MALTLTITALDDSGITRIAAEGEVTALDFPAGNNIHFDNLLGPRWDARLIALDMDHVNYIDSSAVGWLLSVHKLFRGGGGKLVLHSLQPPVRQILELLKIDRVVPMTADYAGARQLLESQMAAAHVA